jgi:predicted Zn-dependent protease
MLTTASSIAVGIQQYENGQKELCSLLGFREIDMARIRNRTQQFLDNRDWHRALMMLDMLAALDRHDTQPHVLAAEVLKQQGQLDIAESRLRQVIGRDPKNMALQVALADILLHAGELGEATVLLQAIVRNDPNGRTASGQRARVVAAAAIARQGAL